MRWVDCLMPQKLGFRRRTRKRLRRCPHEVITQHLHFDRPATTYACKKCGAEYTTGPSAPWNAPSDFWRESDLVRAHLPERVA